MNYEYSKVEKDENLWIITLNRPERMNALHSPAHFELEEIFNNFSNDSDAWVAIITGSGDRAFCAGNDLRYQAEGGKLERNPMGFAGLTSRFDLKKPVIAAVNGVAMGGGFEIAACCDLRICGTSSRFGVPIKRLGLTMAPREIQALLQLVGRSVTMEILLEGKIFNSNEAYEKGMVNRVMPDQDVEKEAYATAERICDGAPMVARWHKAFAEELLYKGKISNKLNDLGYKCYDTKDFQIGYKSFLTKTKPKFKNK